MPAIAINGLGRIGRAALKILLDADGLDLVAVNDIADADNLAYLIKYDTVYGRYQREVSAEEARLLVDGRRIPVLAERDPANLPWGELGVDLVLECTGVFTTADDLERAHPGRRVVRDPLRADEVGDRPHRGARREPPGRPTADHLVRQLHDELHHSRDRGRPPAYRGGARRDDDHPRLHRGPAARGRSEQELPARPGRRGQPGAHLDRGGAGHHTRRAGARRAIRRHRGPCAHPGGLDRGHRVRRQPADHAPRRSTTHSARRPRPPATKASSASRRIRWCPPTSSATRAPRSSTSS